MDENESSQFEGFLKQCKALGKGELEAMVVCRNRNLAFSSFDKKAIKFAEENGIKVFLGKEIFRNLWKNKICPVDRVREIITLIEEKDYRAIDAAGIFEK